MTQSIEKRAFHWASGDKTGVSSQAILRVMTGGQADDWYCYPHDTDDLKRCLYLLACIPEWRAQLAKMKAVGPEWAALVDHWAELEKLYATASRDKVYERMREILDPIEAKRRNLIKLGGGSVVFKTGAMTC